MMHATIFYSLLAHTQHGYATKGGASHAAYDNDENEEEEEPYFSDDEAEAAYR